MASLLEAMRAAMGHNLADGMRHFTAMRPSQNTALSSDDDDHVLESVARDGRVTCNIGAETGIIGTVIVKGVAFGSDGEAEAVTLPWDGVAASVDSWIAAYRADRRVRVRHMHRKFWELTNSVDGGTLTHRVGPGTGILPGPQGGLRPFWSLIFLNTVSGKDAVHA